ncbi:MAG: hypothetical protein OEO23_09910 [Gemmatimonadota bacterium]|nr:hypothetical protein [Gemmatimonadota bacterium]
MADIRQPQKPPKGRLTLLYAIFLALGWLLIERFQAAFPPGT